MGSVDTETEIKCPKCKKMINRDRAAKNKYVCYECGYYFRVKTHNRIRMVADRKSFQPWFEEIEESNPLKYEGYEEKLSEAREKSGVKEAVTVGECEIYGNPSVEGGSVLDSGLIKSIQVKDGQVRVIINDKGYALDDIVEVAYPTISGGGGSDSTGGTDKKPSTDDKTEPPSADKTADSTETHTISDEELDRIIESHRQEKENEVSADVVSDMMAAVDRMNEQAREDTERLYSEDLHEVTGEITPDSYAGEDIQDLEDFV